MNNEQILDMTQEQWDEIRNRAATDPFVRAVVSRLSCVRCDSEVTYVLADAFLKAARDRARLMEEVIKLSEHSSQAFVYDLSKRRA